MKPVFETETCSRCGGGGQYSYCEMYGTKCFKCAGSGKTYSKRGLATRAFLIESCMVDLSSISVGDIIIKDGRRTVTEIKESGSKYLKDGVWIPYVQIVTPKLNFSVFPDSRIQIPPTVEKIEAAMQYQQNLSKAGKPLKRKAKLQLECAP